MKTQLLIIIAVIASSLLTVSQRVSAEEISQLRWLEPNIEQGFCDLVILDQDQETDPALFFIPLPIELGGPSGLIAIFYSPPSNSLYTDQIHPRAPPVSLI